MKPKKDVKFIIYQSLYIFVVCIIAIKGADLNLDAVELKKMIEPGYVYIDTSGKVLIDRDEASKLIPFDSTKFVMVSRDEYNKNPDKFIGSVINNPGGFGISTQLTPPNDNTSKNPDESKNVSPGSDQIQVNFPSNFVQFRQNVIQNPNNVDMVVTSSVGSVIIPPKSSKSIILKGDNTITLTAGTETKSFSVKENKKPQVGFQRITVMNDETKATTLQKNVCYRVTIQDDYPDQLEVKISGPVTYKQHSDNTFDVTMNAFSSRQVYDTYIDNKYSPYTLGFTVTLTDKIAGHKITGQNSFVFGDW